MLKQAAGGFITGLGAGLLGYMVDLVVGASFDALGSALPIIGLLGFIYALGSFFAGLEDAYVAGFFFSFGIITAGMILNDWVTGICGVISIVGIVVSWLWVNRDTMD